jgi:hypothetical protein
VPILHVCGSLDPWLDSQTRAAERRYRELGGRFTVLVEDGKGHFPTAPKDPKPVVDFILSRQPSERSGRRPRDYHFDGTMSRTVQENYLSRAISMEGLLNGRGDLDDNIRSGYAVLLYSTRASIGRAGAPALCGSSFASCAAAGRRGAERCGGAFGALTCSLWPDPWAAPGPGGGGGCTRTSVSFLTTCK